MATSVRRTPCSPTCGRRWTRLDAHQPFFLFAHFADPHEPYEAHGTVSRTADLSLAGTALERVTDVGRDHVDSRARARSRRERARAAQRVPAEPARVRSLSRRGARGAAFPRGRHGATRPRSCASHWTTPATRPRGRTVHLWLSDQVPREELVARYAREVEFSDRHVGLLFDELKRRGLYDDALIVFTSGPRRVARRAPYDRPRALAREPAHPRPAGREAAARRQRARDAVRAARRARRARRRRSHGPRPLAAAAAARPARAVVALRRGARGPSSPRRTAPRPRTTCSGCATSAGSSCTSPTRTASSSTTCRKTRASSRTCSRAEGERFLAWQGELRAAAAHAQESSLDMDSIDPATLEQMRAIGYFGK